ncbi:PDZ domain (Also known as DHR or GLGF) [Botrimarina colliarenosi]|uniref:PDZ domain (Also known as DHR or GLGF) n=1 Tax=Botrimarina colliarenosi TaxID=2528001 RepID=A0A5C6AAN2_9BACT|nr:PDZ domain-containing protein [Botrimarina colliarenosi]TWT96205.1 PDZ domain (Also known as DHR or GLGF) [Botrimarina colliarenosi]
MSRPASLAALSAVAAMVLGTGASAQAGHHCDGGWHPGPAPTVVGKPINWRPQPSVVPTRSWYFGMSLQITQSPFGRGLQVASVTPGSPAARAGLEAGDVLLSAGGVSLQGAYSNEHGVQLLQSAMGAGAPAPTAVATYTVAPSPSVQLTVVNVRTGQLTGVNVQPIATGGPAPTLTSPAPVASYPSPAVSAF